MTDIWRQLEQNRAATRDRAILNLFDDDTGIGDFSAETDGLLLDVSKTDIDSDALPFRVQC